MMTAMVFPSSAPARFLALFPVWKDFILWLKNQSQTIDRWLRNEDNERSLHVSSCWGAPSGAPYFCPKGQP